MNKELERPAVDAAPSGEPTPAPTLATLPRNLIVRSKTNPRSHFDAAYIAELADSIRQHGILQPILVRPLPADRMQDTFEYTEPGAPLPTHEIVCGECRFRACGLAEVDRLPVLIRNLTDIQVLQVQLVENLRRRDLHPLEEAEGFERLMKDHGMSVEDIAAKVNKSATQIYVTLKLLELTPACRQELYAGKLTRSTALLVARAPAYLQVEIAKAIMAPTGFDQEPMSYRQAQRHIQQHYMLQLSSAVFDIKDANLVAKAGDCKSCPKRTGANTDLFEDVKVADTCTDPKCFDAKKVAHHAAVAKAAQAKGQKVIQGKEAKELMPHGPASLKGYQRLDDQTYINGKYTTLRKVMGKDAPVPVLIVNPDTKEAEEVLPTDVANKLIRKADSQARVATKDKAKDREPTKEEIEDEFRRTCEDKAIDALHAAIYKPTPMEITVALARHIAIRYSAELYGAAANRFARLFNVPAAKVATAAGITDFLMNCPDSDVGPALLILMAEDEIDTTSQCGRRAQFKELKVMQLIAEGAGVVLKSIEDQVKADMKEAAAAKKAQAEAPKPIKTKPSKTSAADAKAGISQALQYADAKDVCEPEIGCRIRVNRPGHKHVGRTGRLGPFMGDTWNVTFEDDGCATGKESASGRVKRADFIVIAAPTMLDRKAAWPFPTAANP